MKILLLSDPHINRDNFLHVENIFYQAFDVCASNEISKIFCLGDVFTSRVGQGLNELITFGRILKKAHKMGILITSIAGNHDKTDYDSDDSFLIPFENYESFDLLSKPATKIIGSTHFHFVSFYNNSTYKEKLSKLKISKNKNNVLLTHCSINGVRNLSGMVVDDGVDCVDFSSFKRVFVGHYHNRQKFSNVTYIGSPDPRNWGEDNEKGFTILDTETLKEVFVKSNFTPYEKIEVSVSDLVKNTDIEEFEGYITQYKDSSNLRVVLVGTEEELLHFDSSFLKGVDVKKEKLEKRNSIQDAEKEKFAEFDTDSIQRLFTDFCKQSDIKGKTLIQGLKILKGNFNV